jgi:D-apionate oxidoisomerase
MTTIALFGAGGKAGYRLTENLMKSDYNMKYLEISKEGIDALKKLGLKTTTQKEALRVADVVILAVPDLVIHKVAAEITQDMKKGAMIMCLDVCAAHAGKLPKRKDISYFIVHPCHPPFLNDEKDMEARRDLFGGRKAKQHLVCALFKGNEADYKKGAAISRIMYAPVMKAHRITVEQMALLEPALAETLATSCIVNIREGMSEIVRRGVPEEVAFDFMMGHLNIGIGIAFGLIDAEFSDGCKLTVDRGQKIIFKPNWIKIFKKKNVLAEVKAIVSGK